MRLPRLLVTGLSALALAGLSHATDFIWPGHGTIHFDVPDSWRMVGKQAEEIGYAFNAKPKSGAAAKLQITLAAKRGMKPTDAAELPQLLQRVAQSYLSGSVEKKFTPVPLPLTQGVGYYVHLTDRSLVGKPPQPGNFKAMRNAVAALDPRALVVITLQFDDPDGSELSDMMAMVRSMRFDRDESVRAAEPVARTGPFEFTVPQSKLLLRISDAQMIEDSADSKPNYFKLSDRTVSRIASGWFEPAERYDGLKEFWHGESAALTKNGFKPQGVEFAQLAGWEVIFYHQTLSPGTRMCHLRAELTRAGTWIDLHLSATGSEPISALRQRLTSLLSSVEIAEK
ncbi:MAG: hypothetical protein KF715_03640 [Candidatus Didemnitutus sp.]|nr:hypothetical protein [Candidatus Didemnitutus sp.]